MSRFNQLTIKAKAVPSTNLAGGEVFKIGAAMELYSLVCTSLLYPKYYESDKSQLVRLRKLIGKVPHAFTAQLAVYAREKMNLRTIPMIMVVELAKIHSGDTLISRLVERVIQRADELTEIMAYYVKANDREGTKKLGKLSNQIKKGLANAFQKFNEYQFAKYNRKGDITLKDVLFLTHPKAEGEKKILFDKIVNDTLEVPYTWETQMSEAGKADSPGTTKKDVWEELIDSRKVGYMALMRNLRNILNAGVSVGHVERVCDYLTNISAVRNSKQLPFRYLSAYRMIAGENPTGFRTWGQTPNTGDGVDSPHVGMVLDALDKAMMISSENIPMFNDETCLIASDVSGSMWSPISDRSVINLYDIGLLMSMMAQTRCKSVTTGIFGDKYKTISLPKANILPNMKELYRMEGKVGYSTNGWKVLAYALKKKASYDRIMMFTDCQMYGGSINKLWAEYREKVNPNCKLYIFDLGGYGGSPVNIKDDGTYLIAGWSDQIFNIMANIEKGKEALDAIKETVL